MATVHIEALKDDVAEIVIMPGDPKRAYFIAKTYLQNYKLISEVRGMTAYTGYYKDKRITVFPSGMGNPSMGIYSYELFKFYDVKKIVRIGSCGGYQDHLHVNDVILVDKSYSDSTFAYIQNKDQSNYQESNLALNKIIIDTAKESNLNLIIGNIYSSDVFYEEENNYQQKIKDYNALGVEMETFALFHNAKVLNKSASALLTVSDLFFSQEQLSSEEREKKMTKMIKLSLDSLIK